MATEHSRSAGIDPDQDVVDLTEQHVREHLSSVADSDDDPTTLAENVRTWVVRDDQTGEVTVRGVIDADPNAYYLREDFVPEDDPRPDWMVWCPSDDEETLRQLVTRIDDLEGQL